MFSAYVPDASFENGGTFDDVAVSDHPAAEPTSDQAGAFLDLADRGGRFQRLKRDVQRRRQDVAVGVLPGWERIAAGRLPHALLLEVFTNEGTGTLVVNDIAGLTPAEQGDES